GDRGQCVEEASADPGGEDLLLGHEADATLGGVRGEGDVEDGPVRWGHDVHAPLGDVFPTDHAYAEHNLEDREHERTEDSVEHQRACAVAATTSCTISLTTSFADRPVVSIVSASSAARSGETGRLLSCRSRRARSSRTVSTSTSRAASCSSFVRRRARSSSLAV